jgi:hypothetical protein
VITVPNHWQLKLERISFEEIFFSETIKKNDGVLASNVRRRFYSGI